MAQVSAYPHGTAPYPAAAVLDAAILDFALQPTAQSGCLFSLPAGLHEVVLQAALKDPDAFKKLTLVCGAWATAVPTLLRHLRCHVSIREDAFVPGKELAQGMSQVNVVSLKLPSGSVRGPLPTDRTRGPAAAAAAEEEGTHHGAPWTASLESLDLSDVDFMCTDASRDLPRLTELTCTYNEDVNSLPRWLDVGFPPELLRLKLYNCSGPRMSMLMELPLPEYHGFPRTLRSLHLTRIGETFFTCLGDLSCLESLTIIDSYILELPATIGNLTQLQDLTIEACRLIHVLPDQVSDLVSLTSLRIVDCNMHRFPDLGTNLQSSLRVLQLTDSDNMGEQLENFPRDLGDCLHLRNLLLVSRDIDTFPDLRRLSALRELRVDLPEVTALPDVFAGMAFLRRLFISCKYTGPNGLPASLGDCLQLRTLHLHTHDIDTFPDLERLSALRELRVDLPRVEEVPDVFAAMASLKKLFISCKYPGPNGLPASLATSTTLEVLHINCETFPRSPTRIICPPNLRDLRIVGSQPWPGTEPNPAHGHIKVVLNESLKKTYLKVHGDIEVVLA